MSREGAHDAANEALGRHTAAPTGQSRHYTLTEPRSHVVESRNVFGASRVSPSTAHKWKKHYFSPTFSEEHQWKWSRRPFLCKKNLTKRKEKATEMRWNKTSQPSRRVAPPPHPHSYNQASCSKERSRFSPVQSLMASLR